MIQEIRILNVLSIKDEVIISFVPKKTNIAPYSDSLFIPIDEKRKVLKAAILYGANASGKSNVVNALEFLRNALFSGKRERNDPIAYSPFKFDPVTKQGNGRYLIDFFIDGTRYVYTMELNAKSIVAETLIYYPSTQPANIFSRKSSGGNERPTIQFGAKVGLDVYQRQFFQNGVAHNESLFATLGSSNVTNVLLNTVYEYLKDSLLPLIIPSTDLESWAVRMIRKDKDRYNAYVVQMLNKADIQIEDFRIEEDEVLLEDSILSAVEVDKRIPQSVKEQILSERRIEKDHPVFTHTYRGGQATLEIEEESNGTRRFLGLSIVLHELISKRCFVSIDELESSLHPDLMIFFLNMFLYNASSSQMLITTHNTRLLECDHLSPDMFLFCEKDRTTGATVISRGSDYGLHRNNSIANFYKIGKLGAVPYLGSLQVSEDTPEYHG